MQKHAYLILAHNDRSLLQDLITCLDDSSNDIFVHWDAKSGPVPQLKTTQSCLYALDKRIEVNWAGYSMVKAEYLLFKEALAHGPYIYYHLLSGADLPIKSQSYIHEECERLNGTEFVGFSPASTAEIDFRVQHFFPFSEDFRTKNLFKRGVRFLALKIQDLIRSNRTDIYVKKGSQWCSLTQSFVEYLITQEKMVETVFSHTFCPDELFIQTVIINSPFKDRIKNAETEFEGNMRFIKWQDGELIPIDSDDLSNLKDSDKWFARKFCGSDRVLIALVKQLCK